MLSACSTGVFHCKLYPRSISSWLCSFIDGLPQPSHWEFVVHLWIWSCCVSSSVHCFFSPFLFFKLDGKAGEAESAWSKEKLFFLFTSVFVNSEIQKTPTRESCGYWGIQQTMLEKRRFNQLWKNGLGQFPPAAPAPPVIAGSQWSATASGVFYTAAFCCHCSLKVLILSEWVIIMNVCILLS